MTSGGTPNKVSQVFSAAARAFNHLGELTMQLHTQYEAIPGSKWTDEEVDLLRKAVQQFGNDLEKVTAAVKTRTISQVKHAIKRKVYNEAGMPLANKQAKSQTTKKRPPPSTSNDTPNIKTQVNSVTSTHLAVPVKKPRLSNSPHGEFCSSDLISELEIPPAAIITEYVTSDSVVDVENLDESSSSLKKLDQFINSQPIVGERTPGGVLESAVSNPPLLPPLDFVSEQI